MKIRTILLMGGLVLLGACSESKYDLDQLVPMKALKALLWQPIIWTVKM